MRKNQHRQSMTTPRDHRACVQAQVRWTTRAVKPKVDFGCQDQKKILQVDVPLNVWEKGRFILTQGTRLLTKKRVHVRTLLHS